MLKRSLLTTCALLSSFLLISCAGFPWPQTQPPPPPAVPETVYDYEWEKTSTPVAEPLAPGQVERESIPVAKTERVTASSRKTTPPPPPRSFLQRTFAWFAGWGTLSLVALIVITVISPVTGVSIVFWLWRRARRAARETWAAIEENSAKTPTLKTALDKNQSTATKIAVAKWKEEV